MGVVWVKVIGFEEYVGFYKKYIWFRRNGIFMRLFFFGDILKWLLIK